MASGAHAAGTSCVSVAHAFADARPRRFRTARRQPAFLRRAVDRRAPDRARTLQHLAAGPVPPRARAAPAGGGAGIAPAPADRGYAVRRYQCTGAGETARVRRLRDARLHHGSALRQRGFRPDLRLRCDRARRRRRARPRGALARGGVRGGTHHLGAAASRAVDRLRRFRRPPAPLRAGGLEGQPGTARFHGGAQRRVRDEAEILAPGRPRDVVSPSPGQTGDAAVQPRVDAAGCPLSKTAGAGGGPDRHRRGRGSPAGVPASKRLERYIVFHIVELARRFLGVLALARGGGLFRFPGTCVARPLPAAQHLHAVGDDFGGSALLPFLVLPLARAQGSLDIDLRALLEILAGDFREPAEEHHAVPFGAFLLFTARLVFPGIRGGDRDVGDRSALGVVARLGIAPQIAYQYDFVDRCHLTFSSDNFRHRLLVERFRIHR